MHEIIVLVGYAGSDDAVGCAPHESSRGMVSARMPLASSPMIPQVFMSFLEPNTSFSS